MRGSFDFWPGNFFYKAASDRIMSRHGFTTPVPNTNMGGHYNRYMPDAHGSHRTQGSDVIQARQITGVPADATNRRS